MIEDWRRSISFSDRLDITSKIGFAYSAANPGCAPTESSKYARTTESDMRKSASSLEDYQRRWSEAIQELLASAAPVQQPKDMHAEEHVAPNLPNTGARIGRYEHAEHINDGIFSEIFRAIDPESSKLVALKLTNPSMATPPHDPIREARLLALAKSAHIVPLLETFRQPDGHFVLAFPYYPLDLNVLLHSGRLTEGARKPILHSLFTALAHIHSVGMIHRDIKPSNILLSSPSGPAVLADFGIAWHPSDPSCEPADQKILDVGTTCYRPPELVFGHAGYGEKLDMWASGCVAAQVLRLGPKTLFEAGDLGSELALIRSIFETLGTPDERSWPECVEMPDWGKMNFVKFSGRSWEEILPSADEQERDFVGSLVRFESAERLSASEALRHPLLCSDGTT